MPGLGRFSFSSGINFVPVVYIEGVGVTRYFKPVE
jgi:hypothetical protein